MRTAISIIKAENLLYYSKGKINLKIWKKAQDYLNDAKHFLSKKQYYNAIAAADYAFGLLEGALTEKGFDISKFY